MKIAIVWSGADDLVAFLKFWNNNSSQSWSESIVEILISRGTSVDRTAS